MRTFAPARRAVCLALSFVLLASAGWARPLPPGADGAARRRWSPSVVISWNDALLEAVRRTNFRPMWVSRALMIVHTAMFDAWAAYDDRADGVYWAAPVRQPRRLRTTSNAETAASMAAYRTLVDLFPSQQGALFDPLAQALGLDPGDTSYDLATPTGVGNQVAAWVVSACHDDGANQLGLLSGGTPYGDYTGYRPVNTPDVLSDPNRWQPLRSAAGVVQVFLAPHWSLVTPFALTSASQFRPAPPPQYPSRGYLDETAEIVALSARLTDRQKVIAEYWADGPATETPPGHWSLLAQWVSARDRHTFDQDIVLFFALGSALHDAAIAVWDAKVAYDFVRPLSAVRFVYGSQIIEAWGGPGRGTRAIPGTQFQPYIATPPFAEYTSGHSAFSAAAADVLTRFTGSRRFGATYTKAAGTSTIEPGLVPAESLTLAWRTFQDASDEAAFSRRLGGIHFMSGDLESRTIGRKVGRQAFHTAMKYLAGRSGRRADHPGR
ncbi:MAG: vanadium-dependent haloperoxidase [Vicinamibacterales bacterium]